MSIWSKGRNTGFWMDFLRRNGYPQNTVSETAHRLEKMSQDLQDAVIKWDNTGSLPDIEAEGFTIAELVEKIGLNDIAAFLMIDWLRRDPQGAGLALAQPMSGIAVDERAVAEMKYADEVDAGENT